MEKYIIFAIVAIVAFGPTVAWRVYRVYRYSKATQDFVSKPFVCPNCGHRFYTQQRIIHPVGENKAYLKCPNCKKRDLCGRPYDFDLDEK
jgi:transcription elongation factor Elf1